MKNYKSIYAPYLEQFINFKRSLGYRYHIEEYTYLLFDRFIINENENVIGISRELSEKWGLKRSNEKERTWYIRISLISQFAQFLTDLGYLSHVARLPKINSTYIPHIFSDKEVALFLSACDVTTNKCIQYDTSISIVPAFFRLLYATGIRVSEAAAIKNKDINFNDAYIIIRATKNGRDRVIPLSDSVLDVCRGYKDYKEKQIGSNRPEDYFFVTHAGSRCTRKTIYNWFRKILSESSIPHGGKGNGPRAHDFRHTFSVHALRKMTRDGMDLYYSLPILSTYLGHQSIKATEQYVRLTADLYPDLLNATNSLSGYVFPK